MCDSQYCFTHQKCNKKMNDLCKIDSVVDLKNYNIIMYALSFYCINEIQKETIKYNDDSLNVTCDRYVSVIKQLIESNHNYI